MSYWRSCPNPVWVAIWLFFLPPVNLINLVRMIGYTRATRDGERDENFSAIWMLLILSIIMTVVVALTVWGLIWLVTEQRDLVDPYLGPFTSR